MSAPVASWGDTTPPGARDSAPACADPACDKCGGLAKVLDAGARVICEAAGGDFDTLRDPHSVAHYRQIADGVFSAMSQALLDLRVVVPVGETAEPT